MTKFIISGIAPEINEVRLRAHIGKFVNFRSFLMPKHEDGSHKGVAAIELYSEEDGILLKKKIDRKPLGTQNLSLRQDVRTPKPVFAKA